MLAGAELTLPLGSGRELGASVLPPPEGAPRSRVLLLHARYRLLNRTGVQLRTIGCRGWSVGRFIRPFGLALVSGHLCVGEYHRLSFFTLDGEPRQVVQMPKGALCKPCPAPDSAVLWVGSSIAQHVHRFHVLPPRGHH